VTVAKQIEKALFDTALELDPAARSAFLDQACRENAELRQRLEKLLSVHGSAENFFDVNPVSLAHGLVVPETPAAAAAVAVQKKPANGEDSDMVIGHYRLLQRLGEGGCGVVYLAEQQLPLRRKVALKIIRLGMDTESVIARFETERQVLALMDHPHIAHVLDAGATETGRPFFVMELVQGVKITTFCNENNLDTRQRLNLFIQICHAVQHAHQKGIIHRDIKPSNILVTTHDGVAVPKVIDFGIAKATEGRLIDNTFHTAIHQFIGTPAYMSPEQADNSTLDVDTRSDIYSLGVLLYELLTGQTPFDSKKLLESGVDEMRRTLRESEPQPPSWLLTRMGNTELTQIAVQHHAEPPRLISSMRGDLDWIVMKALEKDRQRRYETANGLAMDVQRYLKNEPVIARPPSNLYRFQKLVRRNKIIFVAIAAVTLALLMGLGISTWMYFQEREARQSAVQAEKQQIRLREEADYLRFQAENRQKLTVATVLLSRDRTNDADQLIADIPAPEPNLEYAALFRTLGDWQASQSHWKLAADRLRVLVQINQPDDWDTTTLDYLRYAPVLVEIGDVSDYDQFRKTAVDHFAKTTNPLPAERVLKMSLLMPADAAMLRALQPLAQIASDSLAPGQLVDPSLAAWRSFSLALMAYRCGDFAGAEIWCKRSIAYQNGNVARAANLELLLAMTDYQLGKKELARSELVQARVQIDGYFAKGVQVGEGGEGFWFDWLFARILMGQATNLIPPATR
jgi:eukaryotic-like serine/threonine-protein kinase